MSANVLCAAVHARHNAYVHGDEDDGNSDVDGGLSREDDDVENVNNSDVSESGDVEVHGTDSSQRGDTNNDGGRGSSDDGDTDSDGDDGNGGAGVVHITVSFDGTWHKRGVTSNYGVGIVTDVSTGLVLDFEVVLSKYCQACALHNNREIIKSEREEWRREHASHCDKNYEGSSKGRRRLLYGCGDTHCRRTTCATQKCCPTATRWHVKQCLTQTIILWRSWSASTTVTREWEQPCGRKQSKESLVGVAMVL